MPDPKKYESESDWMAACVPAKKAEGKTQEQAVGACMGIWNNKEADMEEKMMADAIYRPFGGATSFAELRDAQEAQEAAFRAQDLTWQFQDLLGNIMSSDIEDKAAAIRGLTDEFLSELESLPKTKTLWDHIKEAFSKEKPMKTVGGTKYPSSDFLVVEDPQSPSTWHLQVKKHGTPDHGLMGAAKAALTSPGGHRGNQYQGPNKQEAIAKLKRLYKSEGMEWATKETNGHPFMVWKEGNQYRWLAVYSNKWRDEDNPPEILASEAHKNFVKAVDEGDWPYPETWLWHTPGTRFGVADFVAYDESGFALASGTVDKGQEHIAQALSKDVDLATSHGMPVKEIERDTEDPTIITRYRTIEISPLPREAAANKHGTGYEILQEVKMAIPDNKRPWLEDKLGADGLAELEKTLAGKAKELEELEIESKESEVVAEQEVVEDVGVEEEEAEPKEESKEEAPVEEAPQYVTGDEVAEAVGTVLKPLMERLAALEGLAQVVEEQSKALKQLQKSDEEKVKETIANTPAASLFDRITSVIGAEETYVDGRTSLAKSGPKENEGDRSNGPTPVGVINEMLDRSWSRQQ